MAVGEPDWLPVPSIWDHLRATLPSTHRQRAAIAGAQPPAHVIPAEKKKKWIPVLRRGCLPYEIPALARVTELRLGPGSRQAAWRQRPQRPAQFPPAQLVARGARCRCRSPRARAPGGRRWATPAAGAAVGVAAGARGAPALKERPRRAPGANWRAPGRTRPARAIGGRDPAHRAPPAQLLICPLCRACSARNAPELGEKPAAQGPTRPRGRSMTDALKLERLYHSVLR